ncbi:MAG: hypothetical protein NW203_12255 [Hyphomonadaceae bacterium]|nr:hypothetical protein [Hyphomonadaceae bacterium]
MSIAHVTIAAAAIAASLALCAAPAAAQTRSAACAVQQGAPRQPLQRLYAGEHVIEATPGTAVCGPLQDFRVNCNVVGPAVIWADVGMAHNVIAAGQTAVFTLQGGSTRCLLQGVPMLQPAPPARGASRPPSAPSAAQAAPQAQQTTATARTPRVTTTACARANLDPGRIAGLPVVQREASRETTLRATQGSATCTGAVMVNGRALGQATCQVRGPATIVWDAVQDFDGYQIPAGRTATFVERGAARNDVQNGVLSCFLNAAE